MNDKQ